MIIQWHGEFMWTIYWDMFAYWCLTFTEIHRTFLSCYPQLSPPVAPSDLIRPPEPALLSPRTVKEIPAMIWQCYPEIIHVEDVEVNVKGNGETIHFGDASSSRNGNTSILIPGNDWKCCLSVAVRLLTNRKPHQFQKWNSATPVMSRLLKYFGNSTRGSASWVPSMPKARPATSAAWWSRCPSRKQSCTEAWDGWLKL